MTLRAYVSSNEIPEKALTIVRTAAEVKRHTRPTVPPAGSSSCGRSPGSSASSACSQRG